MKTEINDDIKENFGYTNKNKIKIILCIILSILFISASFYLFKLAKTVIVSQTDKIDYSLNGNIDYKVQLKDNEYYKEDYLKSGMKYISSLIKSIDISLNYEAHATEKIDYKYKYKVTATTLVTDKNDKSKVIFEDPEVIVKENPVEVNNNSFAIDQIISINYDKYNEYILKYKKEYALNSLFDLVVKINVETTGSSKISSKSFTESKEFTVNIPLSEQVIDISVPASNYRVSGVINGIVNKTTKVTILYTTSMIFVVIAFGLLVYSLIMIILKNKEKSIYKKVIDKYLKEYDRAIVITHKTSLNEKDFDKVIEISSMQEMLDLHDNFQLPILYYEIKKNEKSYFVIIKDNILYKLVISKKELENNREKKDEKK